VQNASTYNFGFSAGLNLVNDYPFGMVMPGRFKEATSGAEYRFGFNGMEKADDIAQGNYTTPFRELDPRLGGRWWSPDPIVKPWESPYAGFANNPIVYSDPSGLDAGDKCDDCMQSRDRDGKLTGRQAEDVQVPEVQVSAQKPIGVGDYSTLPSDGQISLDYKPGENEMISGFWGEDTKSARQDMFNLNYHRGTLNAQQFDWLARKGSYSEQSKYFESYTSEYMNQAGGQILLPFVVGLTLISPIPGDEYLSVAMRRFMGSAFQPINSFRTVMVGGNELTIYAEVELQASWAVNRYVHRKESNNWLFNQTNVIDDLSVSFGYNVRSHMASGKSGLLNPAGLEWHHVINSDKLWLLSRTQHRAGIFQNFLHPLKNGGGGFSQKVNGL
jgi:RHS repeat-associated protein